MRMNRPFESFVPIGFAVAFSFTGCGCDDCTGCVGDDCPKTYIYTCRCNCDISGPYTSPGLYADVVEFGKVFVCAKDLDEAKAKCPNACYIYEDDWLREANSVNHCNGCKIDQQYPRLWETGKCVGGRTYPLLSGLPPSTSIEGPIDFGVSYAEIEVPSQGDGARVSLKGKVAIGGGNCRNAQCPISVWYLDVGSLTSSFATRKGHTVERFAVINEGVWTGTKYADNTFVLSPTSRMTMSAAVDGQPIMNIMTPTTLQGKIIYGEYRGNTFSNAIVVDGSFAAGEYRTQLHVLTWITNCQPTVNASAYCYQIDQNEPPSLMLYSSLGLLGNLQDQDLCNAMLAADPAKVCRAGGSIEFPTFACMETVLPVPSDQTSVSRYLRLSWRDASGMEISDQPVLSLRYMPAFPITLRVENQWGRGVESVIQMPPQGSCPVARVPSLPPVADAGNDQVVSNIETILNGSRSFDPQGGPLMFSWRFVFWRPSEDFPPTGDFRPAITSANTATPTVRMPQFGDHVFELKVTNNTGLAATAYVHVTRKPCAECGR